MRQLRGREHFGSSHLPLRVERVELSRPCEAHTHDFHEVALVTRGRCRHRTSRGHSELRAGSLLLLRPGAWHAFEEPRGLEVVNCLFGRELLSRELAPALDDPALRVALQPPRSQVRERGGCERGAREDMDRGESGVLSLQLNQRTRRQCESHLKEIERLQKEESSPANALGRLGRLGRLSLFLAELAGSLEVSDLIAARFPRGHEAVRTCIAAMEGAPGHPWSLGLLAARVHLNPRYVIALFQRDVGVPPLEYLHRCRLERAASLLAEGDEPVVRVAARVGWEDANLFARRFRAHFACTPAQFRKRFR
jgi:AraC family L-rhamnose operon transcriptional activator RhaR